MIEITEKDPQDVPLEDEYTAMLESQGEEATKAFYICFKKTCVLVPACLNICKTLKYKRYLKERDRGGTDGLG